MRVSLCPPTVRAAELLNFPSNFALPDLAGWKGRASEVSENEAVGALTWIARFIEQAQALGEQTLWVAGTRSVAFPPDLAARGLDLAALTFVTVPTSADALQAVEWALRSRAFALLVVDAAESFIADSRLGRLVPLASQAQAALVFLTQKSLDAASLGSLVSRRVAIKANEGVEAVVLKNRGGALSPFRWTPHGPMGLY